MREKERFEEICKITTDVLNLPEGSLKGKSRDINLCLGRQVASVIAIKNGIKRTTVADCLNKNRTSTNYYTRKHKTNFTGWIPYAKAYVKVCKILEDIENSKNVFFEKISIQKLLEKEGVKQSKNPKMIFTIKSGKVKFNLLSDYSKFSDDYSGIKKALKGYYYELNWKDLWKVSCQALRF